MAERCHCQLPIGIDGACCDSRLCHVIDHKANVSQLAHDLQRGGQLARAHQELVREAGLAHRLNAAQDLLAHEPGPIALVVDLVPDADQVVSARGRAKSGQSSISNAGNDCASAWSRMIWSRVRWAWRAPASSAASISIARGLARSR